MQPRAAPIALAIRKASSRLPLNSSSTRTATYMDTVAIAGKERSMPPESMTTNTPIAMVPMIELLLRMSKRFSAVKKDLLMAFTRTEKPIRMSEQDELVTAQEGSSHHPDLWPACRVFSCSRISLSEVPAASSSAPIRPSFMTRMRCE